VPAVDQQVGGRDHPAVRGAHHRAVVTWPQLHRRRPGAGRRQARCVAGRRLAQPGEQPVDQTELACLGNGNDAVPLAVRRRPAVLLYVLPRNPVPTTRGRAVVQAYILIQTEVGKAALVAQAISGIKGVTQAEDVTGPYDVIVRAEARNVDELGRLVVAKVQSVEGITRTLTCPVVHL
jgi:DNA-binding Lrp family transcriptional regulator